MMRDWDDYVLIYYVRVESPTSTAVTPDDETAVTVSSETILRLIHSSHSITGCFEEVVEGESISV